MRGRPDRRPRGTGFFVGERLIATSRHFVDGPEGLEVCFGGARRGRQPLMAAAAAGNLALVEALRAGGSATASKSVLLVVN